MHELGHLFVQYLSRGKVDTPPKVSRTGKNKVGEAGAYLEVLMFGGCVVPTHNPDEDDDQVYSYLRSSTIGQAYELISVLGRRASPGCL